MNIPKGATNQSIYFYIVGDAGHATPGEPITGLLFSDIETGGSASYARAGAARVDLTLITLASASAAHSDGGFILVDDTNMPGLYRCDYPDLAFATGVDQVYCQLVAASGNNAIITPVQVDLNDPLTIGSDSKVILSSDAHTGAVIPTVTTVTGGATEAKQDTAQTDLDTITGTAGVLIGTDAANVTEISDAVWDEVLTGGNHNGATTAGRRLRALNDFGQYEGGAVWYDDVNGTAGAVDYENGTVQVPTTEEASVTTLMASLGYTIIHCVPGSTYVLEAAYANKVFLGENWTLDLNGQSIVGCTFIGATVSGVGIGTGTTQQFIDCLVGAVSIRKGTHFKGCGLSGTQTLTEAGEIFYDNCHSAVAGAGSVTFDFGAALNSSNFNVRHHSGGWTIANMGAGTGTYNASFEGNGQIVWAASCSATSNASIRGNWKITDNASGAVTETLDDNQTSVDAILTDTAAMQPEVAKMVFTKANELDVNTKSINDAEVVGDGNATPWDGV